MRTSILRRAVMAVIVLWPVVTCAQTTFMPVLSVGKAWEVATVNRRDTTGFYRVMVSGDTLVSDRVCKKITIASHEDSRPLAVAVAYEEDGKVWNVKDGELVLLFDLNLKRLDKVGWGFVVREDAIYVNGKARKRLLIDSGMDGMNRIGTNGIDGMSRIDAFYYYFVIVEGIGVSNDHYISSLGIGNENEFCCMLSCSENGETIFTKEDFRRVQSSVAPIAEDRSSAPLYDLTGREVPRPARGNIYISNGRKIAY